MRRSRKTVSIQTHRRNRMSMENEENGMLVPPDDVKALKTVVVEVHDEVKRVNDVLLKGKTMKGLTDNSNFTRNILIDAIECLRNVSYKLLENTGKMIDGLKPVPPSNTEAVSVNEIENVVKTMIPQVVKLTIDAMKEQDKELLKDTNTDDEKHVVIIEDKQDTGKIFTKDQWSDVVKQSVTNKLKTVPVSKAVLTKEGKVCLIVPTKEAQNNAKTNLENEFNVTTNSSKIKQLLPKMKITDIDTTHYKTDNSADLIAAILEKDKTLSDLITNNGYTMEVVFIHDKGQYAIVKMSPEIRSYIINNGRKVNVDLSIKHVKDQLHLTQCFTCQEFGHKTGSPHCKASSGSPVCLYCAGSHLSKNCLDTVKKDSSKHKCSNCLKSTISTERDGAIGHTTTNSACPRVVRESKRMFSRTAGLTEKNFQT